MKITFFLLLLFVSLHLFAQTETATETTTSSDTQAPSLEQVQPEAPAETQDNQDNSDGFKIDLKNADPKIVEQLKKFQKDNEDFLKQVEENKNDPTFLLKMMNGGGKGGGLFKNGDPKAFLRGAILPFKLIPENELRDLILKKAEGSYAYEFLLNNPRVFTFLIRVLKDDSAIPLMGDLIKDKVRLATFLILNLVIIVVAWLFKRYSHLQKRTILESLKLWFIRFTLVNVARLGLVIFFFHVELAPTWNIFVSVFF